MRSAEHGARAVLSNPALTSRLPSPLAVPSIAIHMTRLSCPGPNANGSIPSNASVEVRIISYRKSPGGAPVVLLAVSLVTKRCSSVRRGTDLTHVTASHGRTLRPA